MKPTQQLHELGQKLWLDNITRDLLDSGTLKRYIEEWSITGLTSNPTIFDEAIGNTKAYDDGIRKDAGLLAAVLTTCRFRLLALDGDDALLQRLDAIQVLIERALIGDADVFAHALRVFEDFIDHDLIK